MYCPNCGSNNLAETKYCTRCGTNLGVVADALSGKLSEPDKRNLELLTDYYRGRLSMLVGAVSITLATLILILLQVTGSPGKLRFLNFLAIAGMIYGAIAIAWGVEKWNDSSGEIKALGYTPGEMKARRSAGADSARPELEAPKTGRAIPVPEVYSTDPIAMPASVTEQTTRDLDERARRVSLDARPEEPR